MCFLGLLKYNLYTIKSTHFGLQCCEFWQMYTVVELSSESAYRTFPLPHKVFLCSVVVCSLPSPWAPGNHLSDFCPHSFAFLECHINGITQYVAFCVWLLSCSIMLLRFIHAVVCIRSMFLFYCCVVVHCMDGCTTVFISSPVDGHLGCFQF